MPAAQIDKRFYDSPYYIVPTDNVGQEAFAVIRDAMRGKGMVALGRIVLAKRERVIALEPYGKGLLGTTLHYAYEVRKAEEYFDDIADIKVPGEMLKLAEHILETKKGDFDPSAVRGPLRDGAGRAAAQEAGRLQAAEEQGARRRAAQRHQSDGRAAPQRRSRARRPPAQGKKGRKRVEGQREMLLPIEGKQAPQRAAAKKPGARRKAG